jgi:death-on-curing family protein
VSGFVWPDKQAILDDLLEYFEEVGQPFAMRSMEDYEAGFERARTAADYIDNADTAHIAALLFEGIATRHPLVDGNKRLAWQCMTVFLDMNGIWFDAQEYAAYEMAMAVVAHSKTTEHMAEFIRVNTISV